MKKRERRLAAACAGGMLVAAAASWARFAIERSLRLDPHTWPSIAASALAGAGLVAAGVASLRLAPRAGRVGWRALWGWAAAVQLAALAALPLTSSDVFVYLCQGAARLSGASPYTSPPSSVPDPELVALVSPRWVHAASAYGPLFHLVAAAAAWAGRALPHAWGTLLAYKALVAAAVAAGLALAARFLRASRPADAPEIFTLLALGPLLAWETAAQGHNEGFLFLAAVAFVVAASAGREVAAGAALAAGLAVKYALAPLLALYLLLVARRSPARALGAALVAVLLLGAAFAPEWRSVTLSGVLPSFGADATRHARSLTDLVCITLDALGLAAASAAAYRLLSTASLVLCAGLLARAALRSRTVEELAHGYLLFLLALYLTTPWFHPWYVTWALPLLLLERDARWRRFLAAFSVVTVAQWIAPLDPVTSVLADGWAARSAWRLWRERAAAPRPSPSLAAERRVVPPPAVER